MRPWKRVSVWAVVVLSLVGFSSVSQAEVPYVAEVVEDEVIVRAGAGRTFYAVGTIKRGDRIVVDQVVFTWCRIVPPAGVYSYISRDQVERRSDGATGIVLEDRAAVKAASTNGPGESYRLQYYLDKNARVTIVSEEGGFYKIEPPAGAHVFVPVSAVSRVDDAPVPARPTPAPPAAQAAPAPAPAPAADTAPTPPAASTQQRVEVPPHQIEVVVKEPATAPAEATGDEKPAEPQPAVAAQLPQDTPDSPAAADQPDSQPASQQVAQASTPVTAPAPTTPATRVDAPETSQAPKTPEASVAATEPAGPLTLAELEQRFDQARQLPLEQQPIDQLLKGYRALDPATLSSTNQRVVQSRIDHLERNARLARVLEQIGDVRQQMDQPQAPVVPSTPERRPQAARPAASYEVVGQLLASALYDGQRLPRLFRVVVPADQRTIAYVRLPRDVELNHTLGQIVGVSGESRYDPALKLHVLDVKRIDVLERSAQAH